MRFLRIQSISLFSAFLASAIAAQGQTVSALYNFNGQNSSQNPQAVMLAQGRDGELYGTTTGGGVDGSIFKVSTSRIFASLFVFNGTDGDVPSEGVTLADDGNLYGVAGLGGSGNNGLLFKISPSGAYSVLYEFTGGSDGFSPVAAPIQASDGNLYGTTEFNNAGGATLYEYAPSSGDFSVIYQFSRGSIVAPLIQASDGFLYGTTSNGGWANCGTIFKISTIGKLLQSVPFSCHAAGAYPIFGPLLQASDGNFYGTTDEGGASNKGTIFRTTPDFKVAILYSFLGHTKSAVDGSLPTAGLTQATDGNLYGTTSQGGASGAGTLFRISMAGDYKMLYSFNGSAGTAPEGTLMQHTNGMLYGTAAVGGTNKLGTVYQVNLGLGPFITFVQRTGSVGQTAQILGQKLTGATNVTFNGVPATSFTVASPTFLLATVPSGATSGPVVVTTPGATLTSNVNFNVVP
ncbi:MAG TPA: choice-of-anchor tandem repeat GloVer-containing protein [Candidatus Sulfotelmatobacter sp.]